MFYTKIHKYKYELNTAEVLQTNIVGYRIDHIFFRLSKSGLLLIHSGYKWDGVSGPTIDTKNTMLAGLVHDALYQAIRLKLLPLSVKADIDILYKELLIKKGVTRFRAGCHYWAVRLFGASSCVPGDIRIPEILTA